MPTSEHASSDVAASHVDTCPNSPAPPEPLIQAAMRDIPATLADMVNTRELSAPTPERGQQIVLHCRLVRELGVKNQHGKAASEWAIHRLIQQGMLTARFGREVAPAAWTRDGVLRGGGSIEVRELKSSLIGSRPSLWEWWEVLQSSQTDSQRHTDSGGQMRNHAERTPDPRTNLRSLQQVAAARRQEEDAARRIAQERAVRLEQSITLRARLQEAFDSAYDSPTEERTADRKPSEDGFRRWGERFLTVGRILRECDGNIDRLCLEDRLREVAEKTAPAAMKYACNLLLVAAEGDARSVADAIAHANDDAELRRFVLWLPFLLDNLWTPFADPNGPVWIGIHPEGTTQEEAREAEAAFGWRPDTIPEEATTEQLPFPSLPLVGERTLRRDPSPELARDENPERQSRFCQGFDPDWWMSALRADKWRSRWYPREATREAVQQWTDAIDLMRIKYLGPWANPSRAAELEAERESDLQLIRQQAPQLLDAEAANAEKKRKRMTGRGQARKTIIAEFTRHHRYSNGGCLNYEPIRIRALAKKLKVAPSSVTDFIEKYFGSHDMYEVACRKSTTLRAVLMLLNDDFPKDRLFGKTPPGEGDREHEE